MTPNTAPLDPNFQGFAVFKTDSKGRYRFKTIKLGSYPPYIASKHAVYGLVKTAAST